MTEASTVFQRYGLRCPRCGADDALEVAIEVMAPLTPAGTGPAEREGDLVDWDKHSRLDCRTCNWTGKVFEAEAAVSSDEHKSF